MKNSCGSLASSRECKSYQILTKRFGREFGTLILHITFRQTDYHEFPWVFSVLPTKCFLSVSVHLVTQHRHCKLHCSLQQSWAPVAEGTYSREEEQWEEPECNARLCVTFRSLAVEEDLLIIWMKALWTFEVPETNLANTQHHMHKN
jgi:hypothetical protein